MLLSAENLACERGGRTVFSNQNFSLGSGELLQLTGPNGSGNHPLLRSARKPQRTQPRQKYRLKAAHLN